MRALALTLLLAGPAVGQAPRRPAQPDFDPAGLHRLDPRAAAPPTLAGQFAEVPAWAYLATAAVLVLISRPRNPPRD